MVPVLGGFRLSGQQLPLEARAPEEVSPLPKDTYSKAFIEQ